MKEYLGELNDLPVYKGTVLYHDDIEGGTEVTGINSNGDYMCKSDHGHYYMLISTDNSGLRHTEYKPEDVSLQKSAPLTFDMSCMMTDFDRKMHPLTKELMDDYDIPNRFNGTGKYPLHLTNIEAVVRQALWIGFLHGKGWEDK